MVEGVGRWFVSGCVVLLVGGVVGVVVFVVWGLWLLVGLGFLVVVGGLGVFGFGVGMGGFDVDVDLDLHISSREVSGLMNHDAGISAGGLFGA
ncbi:hypothetical protein, partial [Pseudomonas syringae group genomosp. 7]|uniref:hypothetical protein n=1 Tax=Pseudomonas syringae group genomosp. 7 TaxID=251699 RepID=UPI003770199C